MLALALEPPRHLGDDEGARTQGSEEVGAGGTELADLDEVVERHRLDRVVRRTHAVQAARADRPRRLSFAQEPHQPGTDRRLPQPPVHEEQRWRIAAFAQRQDQRCGSGRTFPPHLGGEPCRRHIDIEHRERDAAGVPDARLQVGERERVTAEQEEIVVATDRRHREHVLEDRGDRALPFVARRHEPLGPSDRDAPGRERQAIRLAIAVDRKRVEEHERARQHVARQPGGEVAPQARGGDRRAFHGDHVRDETVGVAGRHGDRDFAHADASGQCGFDLDQVHRMAQDPHAAPAPSREREHAVRVQAPEVARAKAAHPRVVRIGSERSGVGVGRAPVAGRYVCAHDDDLADLVDRRRRAVVANDLDARAQGRPADGDDAARRSRALRRDHVEGGHVVLGRREPVDDPAAVTDALPKPLEVAFEQGLPGHLHGAQAVETLAGRHALEHLPQRHERGVQHADALAREPGRKRAHATGSKVVGDQRGARDDHAEGGGDRSAERQLEHPAVTVGGLDAKGVDVGPGVADEIAVRLQDTLGRAGRPGREVAEREIVRRDGRPQEPAVRPGQRRRIEDGTARGGERAGAVERRGRGEDRCGRTGGDDRPQAIVRVVEVERHRLAPGPHRAEERGHRVDAAFDQLADAPGGSVRVAEQLRGDRARPRVEAVVGEFAAVLHDRRMAAASPRRERERLVHRARRFDFHGMSLRG